MPVKPAFLPVGLLEAGIELLQVKPRVGAQVEHPPVEVFQPQGKGQKHGGVPIQLGEPPERLPCRGHLGRAGQHQEAQGDVEVGGGAPVRRRRGQKGRELLLQLLEAREDSRSVGPEADEVRGLFLRRTTASFLDLLRREEGLGIALCGTQKRTSRGSLGENRKSRGRCSIRYGNTH